MNSISVFADAKYLCEQIRDCIGITKVDSGYEVREGPACQSDSNHVSWVLAERVEKYQNLAPDDKFQQCLVNPKYLVDESKLVARYKQIKSHRFCDTKTGEAKYLEPYEHITDIIRFRQKVDYKILQFPARCPDKWRSGRNMKLLVFGIKSRPGYYSLLN